MGLVAGRLPPALRKAISQPSQCDASTRAGRAGYLGAPTEAVQHQCCLQQIGALGQNQPTRNARGAPVP